MVGHPTKRQQSNFCACLIDIRLSSSSLWSSSSQASFFSCSSRPWSSSSRPWALMQFSFAKASRYGLQALESRPLAWAAKIVNEYHRQLHHHLDHDDHNHQHHDRHHVDHQLRDHHHLDHKNHDHQPPGHHYHDHCLHWSFDHLWWRCYSEFLIVMKVIMKMLQDT